MLPVHTVGRQLAEEDFQFDLARKGTDYLRVEDLACLVLNSACL